MRLIREDGSDTTCDEGTPLESRMGGLPLYSISLLLRLCLQLHYVKEGFPIARGLTIGDLEAEGLARLVLSLTSGESKDSASEGSPEGPEKPPAGVEDEALAECLQISAQELAGLAAEQELILATIKRQRLQQVLPHTTRLVDDFWHEARKEQEAWTARLARGPRGSPVPPSTTEAPQQRNVPWRVIEKSPAPAAPAPPAEGCAANVRTSAPPFRAIRGAVPGASCSPSTVRYVATGGPSGDPLQGERLSAAPWGTTRVSQSTGQSITQQAWQQQQQRQQMLARVSGPMIRHSHGHPEPTGVSSHVREAPSATAVRGSVYRQQYMPHPELVDVQQQRHCVRLSDGRLMCLAPTGPMGPLRPAMLQQRQIEPQQLTGSTAATQRQGTSSGTSSAEETSWLARWMSSSSQGR